MKNGVSTSILSEPVRVAAKYLQFYVGAASQKSLQG